MISIAIAFAFAAAADVPVDPLAPARAGMTMCSSPDDGAKTCRSMTRYRLLPDGSYAAESTGRGGPGMTIEIASIAQFKGGAICIKLTADQVAASRFFKDGKPLPKEAADLTLAVMTTAMTPMFGVELCQSFTPTGNGLFSVTGTVDGAPPPPGTPKATPVMRWVSAADGYKIAP